MVQDILKEVIPEEKIIKPLHDENLLRGEIDRQKDENEKLRLRAHMSVKISLSYLGNNSSDRERGF